MSIQSVKATIRCDGCNKEFSVDLDRAKTLEPNKSIDDYVWNIVRDGDSSLSNCCSVQGNHLLCAGCTKYVDERIEEPDPTYDKVAKTLNEKEGV